MILRTVTLLISGLLVLPAAAQVYRCEHDGVIEFSDRPCDEQETVYQDRGRVSVVEPSGDLAEIAERNREFIQSRRENIAAARQARREARQAAAAEQQAAEELQSVILSAPWMFTEGDAPQQPQPAPESENRPERFSALGGRLPGTRRGVREPPETDRDDREPENGRQ